MIGTLQPKTLRARLAPAIIIALIAAVATILAAAIGYAASTYQARHDDTGITAGYTHQLSFNAGSGTRSATFQLKPTSGSLYLSSMQTSGPTGSGTNAYRYSTKKSSDSSYTLHGSHTFLLNNVFSAEHYLRSVSSGTSYDALVEKFQGVGTVSNLTVDWLIK